MKKSTYPPVFDVFPPYKGGRTVEYNGYVWEFLPGHPLQNLWGFVPQHRLIAEEMLGRPLSSGEDVHHKDECRTNNALDNLEVMSRAAHRSYHARKAGLAMKAPLTDEQVAQALASQGGIKPAARSLGVSHSTLRNRFPNLCEPYRRTSPTNIDNPRDIEAVLRAAADPHVSLKALAKELHMSAMTILRICERRGARWVRKSKAGEVHTTYRRKKPIHRS